MGQDGRDVVGKYPQAAPSGFQDLHFALAGLPPRAQIASLIVHGEGGGEWKSGGPGNYWRAEVVRKAGSPTADVFVEPYQAEDGRPFHFDLTFADGRKVTAHARGGRARPDARARGAELVVRWVGQDGSDRANGSANVGPDGLQDVRLRLERLDGRRELARVSIAADASQAWRWRGNAALAAGAELVRDPTDPTAGDLYFQPNRPLAGRPLKVTATYADGGSDVVEVVAGEIDPARRAAVAAQALSTMTFAANWLGQSADGDVRVALEGVPPGRIAAAGLGDAVAGWTWGDEADVPDAMPMKLERAGDSGRVVLAFPPVRDGGGRDARGPTPLRRRPVDRRRVPRRPRRRLAPRACAGDGFCASQARGRPPRPRPSRRDDYPGTRHVSDDSPARPRPRGDDPGRAGRDVAVRAGGLRAALDGRDQDPRRSDDARRADDPIRRPRPVGPRR